jgi:hypothetical protein
MDEVYTLLGIQEGRFREQGYRFNLQILLWVNSKVQQLRVEMYIKKAGPFLIPAFTVLQSGVDLFLRLLS